MRLETQLGGILRTNLTVYVLFSPCLNKFLSLDGKFGGFQSIFVAFATKTLSQFEFVFL
jgi:hypothetical protein